MYQEVLKSEPFTANSLSGGKLLKEDCW